MVHSNRLRDPLPRLGRQRDFAGQVLPEILLVDYVLLAAGCLTALVGVLAWML